MTAISVSELLGELVASAVYLEERAAVIEGLAELPARKSRSEAAGREAARFRGRATRLRLLVERTTGQSCRKGGAA